MAASLPNTMSRRAPGPAGKRAATVEPLALAAAVAAPLARSAARTAAQTPVKRAAKRAVQKAVKASKTP